MGQGERGTPFTEEQDAPVDEQEILEKETRAKSELGRLAYIAWAAESGEPLDDYDHIVERRVEHARADYQKRRALEELEPSSARWDRVSAEDTAALQELLDRNPDEKELQRFLEDNPKFLIQIMGGGHGRYQRPQPRLGAEFVPDFLVAENSSIGIEWYGVEIESPRIRAHRKDGLATVGLNHAIGQIRDWRSWLANNIDYARRRKADNGLGLVGIDSRIPGLILIGRRNKFPSRYNEFRRQMIDRERIVIHSYDWLVDVASSNLSGRLNVELPFP